MATDKNSRFVNIMTKLESTCNRKHDTPGNAKSFAEWQNGNLRKLQLDKCFKVVVDGLNTVIEIV